MNESFCNKDPKKKCKSPKTHSTPPTNWKLPFPYTTHKNLTSAETYKVMTQCIFSSP